MDMLRKNLLKNNKIKVVFAVLAALFIGNGVFNAPAIEAAGVDDGIVDVLLDEKADLNKVRTTIEKMDADIKVTKVEEINLLRIVYPESISIEDIVKNEEIENCIEVYGNMPSFKSVTVDVGKDYKDKIYAEGDALREFSLEDYLFDALSWHVDEVTNEGKSFDLATGKGVRIALVDSGVDYSHPFLKGKISFDKAKSYVTGDTSVIDYNAHGTMIAGLIGQLSPDAVITPYKVIGASSGESLWTIQALIDAVDDGNDIVNMSLGTYKCLNEESERLVANSYKRAVRYARNHNVLVVASAGNYGIDLDQYKDTLNICHLPGSIDDVCTVSSVKDGHLSMFSNYGSAIDYCAPGGDIVLIDGYLDISACMYVLYPTYLDNGLAAIGIPQGYTFSYGTSLSTALVTGGLADILSYCKDNYKFYNVSDIEKLLMDGSKDLGELGKDRLYGAGELDVFSSLKKAEQLHKGTVTTEDEKNYVFENDMLTLNYNVVNEYEDKFLVEVEITNMTNKVIHNWSLAMNLQNEIDSIWNGKVEYRDGYVIIKNNGYNRDIKANEKVNFGFIAFKDGDIVIPDEYVFTNFKDVVSSAYSIEYVIDAEWESGCAATIKITNNSDTIIEDWILGFEYKNSISNIWNSEIVVHDDEYYEIMNGVSNQDIEPGQTVEFGFIVEENYEKIEPGLFHLLSMK